MVYLVVCYGLTEDTIARQELLLDYCFYFNKQMKENVSNPVPGAHGQGHAIH